MTMIIMTNVMALIVRSLDSMISNLEKVLRLNVGDGNKKQTKDTFQASHNVNVHSSFQSGESRIRHLGLS